MANDNHAHYGRIGLTVFAGAVAIAVALIYIAGIGDSSHEFLVETFYDFPVSGLSAGAAVNFRGVKIGEVKEVQFANNVYWGSTTTEDCKRVCIVMALDTSKLGVETIEEAKECVNRFSNLGVRATIASNAITGLSRVDLNMPENPLLVPKTAWKPRHPFIPPQPSLMENLSQSLTRAVNEFNRMDLKSVWSNISAVAESSAKITSEVGELVETQRGHLETIVKDIGEAADKIDTLTDTLKENPSLLLRSNDPEPLPETAR